MNVNILHRNINQSENAVNMFFFLFEIDAVQFSFLRRNSHSQGHGGMDMITGSLILLSIVCCLYYLVHFNERNDSSIPYATYRSYPIVGHLFSFLRGRTKLLLECQQRYGNCFKIRVFNQRFVLVLSQADWTTVIRNPAFYLPTDDFMTMIYGSVSNFSGKTVSSLLTSSYQLFHRASGI